MLNFLVSRRILRLGHTKAIFGRIRPGKKKRRITTKKQLLLLQERQLKASKRLNCAANRKMWTCCSYPEVLPVARSKLSHSKCYGFFLQLLLQPAYTFFCLK